MSEREEEREALACWALGFGFGFGLLGGCWRGVERVVVALYSLLRRCFTVALFSFGGHRFISSLGNGVAFGVLFFFFSCRLYGGL